MSAAAEAEAAAAVHHTQSDLFSFSPHFSLVVDGDGGDGGDVGDVGDGGDGGDGGDDDELVMVSNK